MVATRVLSGTYREVWQESTAGNFDGGTTVAITTGIRVDRTAAPITTWLSDCKAEVHLTSKVGNPVVTTPVLSMNGTGFLVVTFSNAAGTGNNAAYTLDVMRIHSSQQGVDGTYSGTGVVVDAPMSASSPATGTMRLYVDGTLGSDAAAGTSWATAWKTLARAQRGVEDVLLPNPGALELDLWFRGAFSGGGAATEDIYFAGALAGGTHVNFLHHVDDWTVIDSGTVNTIAATTLAHGMRELTFNGPWVPAAGDQGRWIVFTRGADRVTYQILRVSGATVTISATSVPVWLVGGAVVAASVREPSVTGIRNVFWSYERSRDFMSNYFMKRDLIFGLNCAFLVISNTVGVSVVAKVSNAVSMPPIYIGLSFFIDTAFRTAFVSTQKSKDIGVTGIANDSCQLGSWTPQTDYGMACAGSNNVIWEGYAGAAPDFTSCIGCGWKWSNVPGATPISASSTTTNVIMRLGFVCNHGCDSILSTISFLDLPTAGIANGLLQVRKGGWLQVGGAIDGDNTNTTGALTTLYAIYAEKGGRLQFEASPGANLKGKHGFLRSFYGDVVANVALALPVLAGSGPDIYIEGGLCGFTENVTKAALNTAPSAILQVARGGKVTQATGKNFTLPAGSGNYTTDYGALGAIVANDGLADIRLGTLTGGTGATINIGCTLKNGARLVHAGAGLSGAAAPLDLGGTGAVAWPAAALTDNAAVTPQGCLIIANA